MGIKPLKSLKVGSDPSNYQGNERIVHLSDIEQYSMNKSETIYQSDEKSKQLYVAKEHFFYASAEERDIFNEFIFFLKNNISNIDTTNLYVPLQIRTQQQVYKYQYFLTHMYYPVYEYKLQAELQVRQSRHESFHQTQIWYLILNVLNGIRQFQNMKCTSMQFCMQSIKFNVQGLIKIQNMMSSPKIFEVLRNERLSWNHKNIVNFFVQETYRVGLVLLELCTFVPIRSQMMKNRNMVGNAINNSNSMMSYQNGSGQVGQNVERQISMALQRVRSKYSQLLYNLLNVMLCHPKDRPLPSQIYEVFVPYQKEIMDFRGFNFQTGQFKNSMGGMSYGINESGVGLTYNVNVGKAINSTISQNNNNVYNSIDVYPYPQQSRTYKHVNNSMCRSMGNLNEVSGFRYGNSNQGNGNGYRNGKREEQGSVGVDNSNSNIKYINNNLNTSTSFDGPIKLNIPNSYGNATIRESPTGVPSSRKNYYGNLNPRDIYYRDKPNQYYGIIQQDQPHQSPPITNQPLKQSQEYVSPIWHSPQIQKNTTPDTTTANINFSNSTNRYFQNTPPSIERNSPTSIYYDNNEKKTKVAQYRSQTVNKKYIGNGIGNDENGKKTYTYWQNYQNNGIVPRNYNNSFNNKAIQKNSVYFGY